MRNLICLFLLLSLLLGGCRAAASSAVPTSNATALPTSNLTLERCTVAGIRTAECGYLHVPEDRSDPNSRILDLRIIIARARGPNHEPDPLFYIAGGPGGAATSAVNNVNNIFYEINAKRDIVFLDQRGTNDQHLLSCEYPDFQIADATQQQVNDWMKKCLASLDGNPRFYTTVPAMQDLDDARQALGYDKINLYGISYGTKAEQVYMRMFPEHFRAAVIDHGNALDLPLWPTWPRSSQSALNQLFTYCEQDEKCHTAYPDIRGDWKAVLNRLAKGPVVTSYQPAGAPQPASLSLIDLESGVYQLLYEGNYGEIPLIIHTLASNEDWTEFVKSYSEQHPSGVTEPEPFLFMKHMIDCFEPAEAFGQNAIFGVDTRSYYYGVFMNNTHYWQKVCAALPQPDASLIYGPGKPAPLSALMVNSLLDPIFPPSSMDLALKEFTTSRVVVEPSEGHNTSNSFCRWHMIAQYIDQGSVDDLDTSCLKEIKPSFVTGDE